MNRTNIPQTDSIQELAELWDTHDLTDFEDELDEVNEPVFDNLYQINLIILIPPRWSGRLLTPTCYRHTAPLERKQYESD